MCITISCIYACIRCSTDGSKNINLSFSTPQESQILEKAIKDAYNQGILIVAAAGNDEIVEYPAAYPEVMAVGSVDSEGIVSDNSGKGKELEIVAPGEKVTATSLLGGTTNSSGTSLAAPHVVGVASLLWEKDLSVSHKFIRDLLNYSAKMRYYSSNAGEKNTNILEAYKVISITIE